MTTYESIPDYHTSAQTKSCKNSPATLYHVTPACNIPSILARGVDPAFSRTGNGRIYLAEKTSLFWAINHVSKIHEVPVNRIAIFRCYGGKRVKRLRSGLWFCEHVKKVTTCYSASRFVK